ncbi:MAG: DinB family protein [Pirellula sp.]
MEEPYFEKYLRRFDSLADPVEQLWSQGQDFVDWARSVDSDQTSIIHQPYTWTFREVLKHISDSERVFAFRALWIARGSKEALPSFDEHAFLANSSANETPWLELTEEFLSVRQATLSLFRNLPERSWHNRGLAAGFELDIKMLCGMIYGHLDHHINIMKKRLEK